MSLLIQSTAKFTWRSLTRQSIHKNYFSSSNANQLLNNQFFSYFRPIIPLKSVNLTNPPNNTNDTFGQQLNLSIGDPFNLLKDTIKEPLPVDLVSPLKLDSVLKKRKKKMRKHKLRKRRRRDRAARRKKIQHIKQQKKKKIDEMED